MYLTHSLERLFFGVFILGGGLKLESNSSLLYLNIPLQLRCDKKGRRLFVLAVLFRNHSPNLSTRNATDNSVPPKG